MVEFAIGNPGGPGRPKGSRNKARMIFDAIGMKSTAKAIEAIGQKAETGDRFAGAILLARTWARPRGREVEFELPAIETPADLVRAHAALVAAVADGTLTPTEGAQVSTLLENQRRAVETHQLEQRIRTLEDGVRKDAAGASWSTLR
jgi:hypothetical protein